MNLGQTGYEPVALTTELWAHLFNELNILIKNKKGKCELYDNHYRKYKNIVYTL